eukprot:scaffold1307_cov200-Pinguiococcus_pyrenoidosus.AAC.18
MGCCESTPAVPEQIIPDPGYEDEAVFTIRDLSMFNDDYEVLRGEHPNPEIDRWLFINSGKSRSDAIIEVENYVRLNEEKPKQGQVLYKAVFKGSPGFEETEARGIGDTSGLGLMLQSLFSGQSQAKPHSEDMHYVRKAKRMDRGADKTRIKKWQLNTQARITPGPTRAESELMGSEHLWLKIYAAGAAVATYDKKDEGWQKDVFEFVDCIDFQLTKADGEVIDEWRVAGDTYDDAPNFCSTQLFEVTIERDGMTKEGDKVVKTHAPYDPVLGLLLAHLMTSEYSVKGIKKDFNPRFPNAPNQTGFSIPFNQLM